MDETLVLTSDYGYDALNRLELLTQTDATDVLASYDYHLRDYGMRVGLTETRS